MVFIQLKKKKNIEFEEKDCFVGAKWKFYGSDPSLKERIFKFTVASW